MTTTDEDRLSRLLGFLEADPLNPNLLRDVIEAAIACGDLDKATELNAQLLHVLPLEFEGHYLSSVIAMRRGSFDTAAPILEKLLRDHDHPSVRFNLAWSRAMIGEKSDAQNVLDNKTIKAIPAAAMLKVQLLHEAGAFEQALELGREMLEIHPDDAGLLSAIATLAMDSDDLQLARQCAKGGGNHPEALAASALLELHDGQPQSALELFERSLAVREHNPRAWIGKGLALLVQHDPQGAARDIDHGARQFGDHIGSWIAAGWAHWLAGELDAARQRFERALAIDHNFAESHGSLAVVDAMEGDKSGARRRATTALRLDPACFSAALAQVLMSTNDPAEGQRIVAAAINRPISENGLSIASYMAGLSKPTVH